jgi:predicted TIM-barrel fold metal-dependent hydrolase
MERLLESNRQGTWLWAHTGFFIEPPALRRLFQRHLNLLCELSWRDERYGPRRIPISEDGQLRPEWKELLEEFPDRFVVGTDVADPSLSGYSFMIDYWRGILKQLSADSSEKLSHQNAERILKLPPR